MSTGSGASPTSQVAIVTVTFEPDSVLLARQRAALPVGFHWVVVDNASTEAARAALHNLVAAFPGALFVQNSANVGLAAALNMGVMRAREAWPNLDYVLMLDQDSEPLAGAIQCLVDAAEALAASGNAVGSVGPALCDAETGAMHGFHQSTRLSWHRVYPPASAAPVPCANLNGSGTLVPVAVFEQLGGMQERLFIDHVDTDWAFRVQAAGYGLWGVPASIFVHRMGERVLRLALLGGRPWPVRSPERHFFLYRNAVVLMRLDFVPRVWKCWAVGKLLATMLAHLVLDRRRARQVSLMLAGFRAGLCFPLGDGWRKRVAPNRNSE